MVAVVALAVAGQGCGDGSGPEIPDACLQDAPLQVVPQESDLPLRGQISIRDIQDRTLDANGMPQSLNLGRVQAAFADFSASTSTPAAVTPLGDFCVGRVSRSAQVGARRVSLQRLSVEGTRRGAIEVASSTPGVFVEQGEPLLPDSGELRVVGTSTGGFPGFELTVAPSAPISVSEPTAATRIELGELTVAWNAADSDFVVIVVDPDDAPGQPDSGGQVVCAVPDDGCFVLPTVASAFLLSAQTETYTLVVERHRYRAMEVSGAFIELEAISQWSSTIDNRL